MNVGSRQLSCLLFRLNEPPAPAPGTAIQWPGSRATTQQGTKSDETDRLDTDLSVGERSEITDRKSFDWTAAAAAAASSSSSAAAAAAAATAGCCRRRSSVCPTFGALDGDRDRALEVGERAGGRGRERGRGRRPGPGIPGATQESGAGAGRVQAEERELALVDAHTGTYLFSTRPMSCVDL